MEEAESSARLRETLRKVTSTPSFLRNSALGNAADTVYVTEIPQDNARQHAFVSRSAVQGYQRVMHRTNATQKIPEFSSRKAVGGPTTGYRQMGKHGLNQ
jgi:hypothetical protein